jgi:hypothetical protein
MTQYFVATTRQMVGRPRKRITDIWGPFETFSLACDYRRAWVALWADQKGKAKVETACAPCTHTLEWYEGRMEREALVDAAQSRCEALGVRFDDDAPMALGDTAPVAKERGSIVRDIRAQNGLVD